MKLPRLWLPSIAFVALASLFGTAAAQSVCLPAPRLLTTMPMGGQAGTEFEVSVTGQSLEGSEQLVFSDRSIVATPKINDDGTVVPDRYVVRIDAGCKPGVYDARVMASMGLSSARTFTVSDVPEVVPSEKCNTPESAIVVPVNSVVNGVLVDRNINFYSFVGTAGQRVIVDCACKGIDSKANPVIAVADASGSDLVVQRRGGIIDFQVPDDGTYLVKVHDLTFKGGPYYFFRLSIADAPESGLPSRLPSTRSVSSFSWPPQGIPAQAEAEESEPNDSIAGSQEISLPCDILGTFFPAADVDSFEFSAKKGEVWWVEVASERLGCPTDPSVIVQRVVPDGDPVDIAQLTDIASPVKRSSNGYSYDGPPYNAGSSDVLGKFEVSEDGRYRIRLTDLFGGTRDEPSNRYRMIVRRPQPDFAITGWALHMGLRNGDRNALSKPIALRGGAVMPLEIVVVRRDGFNGEIELTMDNLPEGVSATGLKIGAGQTRGVLLVSATENAPRGLRMARLSGRAVIDGKPVVRDCQLASMKWPVTNARSEIPDPRLVDEIPVSVGGIEQAWLSIVPAEQKVWEAAVGSTLKIPLNVIRRGAFSGRSMSLQTFGAGLESNPRFDLSLVDPQGEATVDLARLKTQPGEYTIAFYGGAVAKYAIGDAKPKDIVDIYVSQPIRIRVVEAEAPSK